MKDGSEIIFRDLYRNAIRMLQKNGLYTIELGHKRPNIVSKRSKIPQNLLHKNIF